MSMARQPVGSRAGRSRFRTRPSGRLREPPDAARAGCGVGTKSRYVTVLLREAGVRPVADPKSLRGYRGSLYRRSEVPDDLAARRETAFPRRKTASAPDPKPERSMSDPYGSELGRGRPVA